MIHLTIELAAIDELISERNLQSIEFPMGKAFVDFLTGIAEVPTLPSPLFTHKAGGGRSTISSVRRPAISLF